MPASISDWKNLVPEKRIKKWYAKSILKYTARSGFVAWRSSGETDNRNGEEQNQEPFRPGFFLKPGKGGCPAGTLPWGGGVPGTSCIDKITMGRERN